MQLPDRHSLEDAARIVYAAMPPTPQYVWPLLAVVLGTEAWLKHENHTPVGAFKLRGGLTYFDALRKREPACPGVVSAPRATTASRSASPRAAPGCRRRSSCRTATRARRTPPCARSASN